MVMVVNMRSAWPRPPYNHGRRCEDEPREPPGFFGEKHDYSEWREPKHRLRGGTSEAEKVETAGNMWCIYCYTNRHCPDVFASGVLLPTKSKYLQCKLPKRGGDYINDLFSYLKVYGKHK